MFAIATHEYAPDHGPLTFMTGTILENVHPDSLAYIMPPKNGWENPTDCGDFPCTYPANVYVRLTGTEVNGVETVNSTIQDDFVILPNNAGIIPGFLQDGTSDFQSEPNAAMNAYVGATDNLAAITIQSLDGDK